VKTNAGDNYLDEHRHAACRNPVAQGSGVPFSAGLPSEWASRKRAYIWPKNLENNSCCVEIPNLAYRLRRWLLTVESDISRWALME
jgi:hypothetical protein